MNVTIRCKTGSDLILLEGYCREELGKNLRARVQQVVDVEINKMMEQARVRQQLKEGEGNAE